MAATSLGLKLLGAGTAAAVAAALRAQERLIVVDNCEHVLAGAAELVAAIVAGCPGVRVVATSRERLSIEGEQLVVLAPLDVGAARHVGVVRRSSAVRRTRPRDRRRVRPGPRRSECDRGHLPPSGRPSAGHRAGRRPPAEHDAGRAARRRAGSLPGVAWSSRRAGPSREPAHRHRLVVRHADRRCAARHGRPVGVQRQLRRRRRGGGGRRRPPRRAGRQVAARRRASPRRGALRAAGDDPRVRRGSAARQPAHRRAAPAARRALPRLGRARRPRHPPRRRAGLASGDPGGVAQPAHRGERRVCRRRRRHWVRADPQRVLVGDEPGAARVRRVGRRGAQPAVVRRPPDAPHRHRRGDVLRVRQRTERSIPGAVLRGRGGGGAARRGERTVGRRRRWVLHLPLDAGPGRVVAPGPATRRRRRVLAGARHAAGMRHGRTDGGVRRVARGRG